jgi:hypothetical protein
MILRFATILGLIASLLSCHSFNEGFHNLMRRKVTFRRLEQKFFKAHRIFNGRKNKIVHPDPEIAKLYKMVEQQKYRPNRNGSLPTDFHNFIEDPLKDFYRPDNEEWQFHDNGTLFGDQVQYDYKSVDFRQDMLGGIDPDMTYGNSSLLLLLLLLLLPLFLN